MGNMGNVSYNTEEIFITYMKIAIKQNNQTILNQIILIFKQLCYKSSF